MGVQGIKRRGILRGFQKCVELLRQEVPKDFFSEKQFFAKFSKPLKIQFFCKKKGAVLLLSKDKRSNKIETVQYFKKHFL